MNCYECRKNTGSMEQLEFSEATLVNIPVDDQAASTGAAPAAPLLISPHTRCQGLFLKHRQATGPGSGFSKANTVTLLVW